MAGETTWRSTREEAWRGHHARRVHAHGRLSRRSSVRLRSCVEHSARVRVCGSARLRSTSYTHERFVGLKLCFQLFLRQGPILDLGSFWRWLRDGACGQSELNLFATLIVGHVGCWDSDHAEDFDFISVAAWKGILNTRQTVDEKDGQKRAGGERKRCTDFSGSSLWTCWM